jgi:LacI family transcriptional regulator
VLRLDSVPLPTSPPAIDANRLRKALEEAETLRASKPRATINDIARIAGVSKKTISRVINDSPLVKPHTRQLIDAIIAAAGFKPDPQARALALGRSFLIGMVYNNPSPQYVVNLQFGILDAIEDSDFQLVLRPCDREAPDYLERLGHFIEQHRPYALVLPPSVSEDEAVVDLLRKLGAEYVRIASVPLDVPSRMIVTNDAEGAAQAARHLAALGHTDIAHIHGPNTFRSAHERRAGFCAGLAESGIDLPPSRLIEGAYTFESGLKATERLLYGSRRPTAIFAGNDEMAAGAYVAVRMAGLRIPEDISIVGFDDTPTSARLWPALTTVRLPIREIGQAAARLLVDPPGDFAMGKAVSFLPEIVVRQSTGRVK